jgi:outer membrane protein insertion porin family
MERKNKVWDFDERSDDLFFLFTRNITDQLRWGPKFMFLSVKSKEPGITLDPDNRDNMFGAGLFMQSDARNLIVYPTKGSFSELLVTYMGGDADYWQGTLDIRRYEQLAGERHSLAFYSLLTMTSGEVGVDIPIYQQFAIGGANTVRGWDLGERYGKNQWLNTLEYWFLWKEPKSYEVWFIRQAIGLQLALLADVGTAWSNEEEFHQNWILGGGAGIRVTIPSNVMFRLDFAYGQSGVGVGLYIGSGEKAEAQRQRVR